MRVGLTVSIVGHVAIFGFGLIAFPDARPFQAEEIKALPVELVSVAEVTDLLQGDESSRIVPEEAPQPQPTVEAEAPTPEPEEKPAELPVEDVAPPPPPPPPEPEPVPEPEPEVAALPEPEPEAAPEPEPVPPVDAPVPKPRPEPPKPVAEPKPAPQTPPTVAEEEEPEFNPDDIAALLNKQEPAGGGDPVPATEPQTLGSIDGHEGAAMTQSEIAALQARLYRCWNPPVAVREAQALVVTVRINLLVDGSLASPPEVVNASFDPLMQVAAESAIRAVVQCAPFGDILLPEKYSLWSQIDFNFDPSKMLN